MRDLHLILGLFVSPFLLVFAVSTLLLNHGWLTEFVPVEGEDRAGHPVVLPQDGSGVDQAKSVLRQLGIVGEIRNIVRRKDRLEFPVMRPGKMITVRVDLKNGIASFDLGEGSFLDRLIYLHKSPGPHNAAIRGNWIFTRIWMWLVDGVVSSLIFVSASGVYLWTALKAERKTGLLLVGLGTLFFFTLVLSLVLQV